MAVVLLLFPDDAEPGPVKSVRQYHYQGGHDTIEKKYTFTLLLYLMTVKTRYFGKRAL
jgi:hypothetical protein